MYHKNDELIKKHHPIYYKEFEKTFVNKIISLASANTGNKAKLRRANNDQTEHYAWELLFKAGLKGDITNDDRRLPCQLIAADIANSMNNDSIDKSSSKQKARLLTLGEAIAGCYFKDKRDNYGGFFVETPQEDSDESKQAQSKLCRLMACDDITELCRVLRPLLSLIRSRITKNKFEVIRLDYVNLLSDLLRFNNNPKRIKTEWAKQFYQKSFIDDDTKNINSKNYVEEQDTDATRS